MNDKESSEFFETLLLSTNERIPVRVQPYNGNGWFRGTLTGVKKDKLLIIPINGQHRHKEIPASLVSIQEGKLSSNLQKLINNIKNRVESTDSLEIRNPMFELMPPKTETTSPLTVQPAKAAAKVAASKTVTAHIISVPAPAAETPKAPDPITDPTPEPIMQTPRTKMDGGFAEKLLQFKQLQAELLSKANTEGIERLKGLHKDLEEAKEMVFSVESEIITTCAELAEFGVNVPDELKPKARMAETEFIPDFAPIKIPQPKVIASLPIPVKKTTIAGPVVVREDADAEDDDDKIAAASATLDEATISKNRNNWCGGKARRYRDKIIQYFQDNSNYLTSGIDLMEYCGEKVAAPTSVLMPLVENGTLKRIGIRNSVRYQLNLNNA